MRQLVAAFVFAAACGVRAPAPINIVQLVQARGPIEARRDLQIRVLAHPRDIAARLALARLADEQGRPTEAIEQLTIVDNLGGPLGTRWHDDDRARLARLLLARARARLARESPTALADFERAAKLGAQPTREELDSARIAVAHAELRHVDAEVRAHGRSRLPADRRDDRGQLGAWLWTIGARREAYEQLAAWHAATKPPRDEALQGAYLRALAWWSPTWLGEVPPPPSEDLVGPERCWFAVANCEPPATQEPALPPLDGDVADVRSAAATRYAMTRAVNAAVVAAHSTSPTSTSRRTQLADIARAYERDPSSAERLARDFVAESVDAATGHATAGALFDALGDPSRARTHWNAAVESSPEVAFFRGLAESAARAGDGPAALVFATHAAAAHGDPVVVWISLAGALLEANQIPDALTAARSALDLAGPETLAPALDIAITASRAMGRTQQADALLVQRAQIAPRDATPDAEIRAALIAHRERPTASTVARLWVASRSTPRDVEVRAMLLDEIDRDDARRAAIVDELLRLTGDRDDARARAAVRALRSVR